MSKFMRQTSVSNGRVTKGRWYEVIGERIGSIGDNLFKFKDNNGNEYKAKQYGSSILDGGDWEIREDFIVYAVRTNHSNSQVITNGGLHKLVNPTLLSDLLIERSFRIYSDSEGGGICLSLMEEDCRLSNGGYWEYFRREEYDVLTTPTEPRITHLISPITTNYLTQGRAYEVIEVRDDIYIIASDNGIRVETLLRGSSHINGLDWTTVCGTSLESQLFDWADTVSATNDSPILEIPRPTRIEHTQVFISNTAECKPYLTAGKFYDIIEELDNKCQITDDNGEVIWIGKNYSEHLYGGKPELIK